jgi:hypothetical protein
MLRFAVEEGRGIVGMGAKLGEGLARRRSVWEPLPGG